MFFVRLLSDRQILGFYKATREGQLKIIITVRDYAYQEISLRCSEFATKTINIAKLTDEQIIDIIKTDDFGIANSRYQKEIVRIADGNPRLAIMTSLLALKEQNIYALADVSGLFDTYFSTFIKDKNEIASKLNLKCLGLIAFFNTIPYKDRETTTSILENFNLDYLEFIEAVDRLECLELLETRFEYVKIPEQNLANYFFYKSFIKDELLSFDVLLANHFNDYSHRFKDCIIPANNTFGVEMVSDKLKPKLKNYLDSIRSDVEHTYNLLSTFWFYLQSETLEFVYNLVEQVPKSGDLSDIEILFADKRNNSEDKILELLGGFFYFHAHLADALQLAFEYIKKRPKLASKLINNLSESLAFSHKDAETGFQRQNTLFEILIKGINNQNAHYSSIFFELSKNFILFRFESTEYRKNQFTIYRYEIPNNEYIQDFRRKIWQAVDLHFEEFPAESLEVLRSYSTRSPDVVKKIMEFDLPYVLEIINKHLSNELFSHCLYVQEQIRWFKENKVAHSSFSYLKEKFTNSIYETYLKIDWNRYRDRDEFEFEDYKEYDKLKEAEIKSTFVFSTLEDIKKFFKKFSIIVDEFSNEYKFDRSLRIIISDNFDKNFELGFQLLELLIDANNASSSTPKLEFLFHLTERRQIDKVWHLINTKKTEWRLSFFYNLHPKLITDAHIKSLNDTVANLKASVQVCFFYLENFLQIEPRIFMEILERIISINSKEKINIHTSVDFFSNYFDYLKEDLELIKKAYLQQNLIQRHFDYYGKGFLKILNSEPNFLIEYANSLCEEESYRPREDSRDLGIVWEVDGIENQLIKVFDLAIVKYPYSGMPCHFCNVFFRKIDPKYDLKVKKFMMNYVSDNYSDSAKIDVIVDIARHSKNELYDNILLYYISLNQDVEAFSRIHWRGNGTVATGDQIIGDIEAADWNKILSIVEKSNIGFKLIPIKKYLNDRIESCIEYAESTRKRRFLGRF